jgi:threonine dehydrogenase-like Zn-dependent dehydrogenase
MTNAVVAGVIEGPEKVVLREYPYPDIQADSGVLKVEAAGIGGVDYELYWGVGAGTAIGYPFIPGHIIVGRIDAIGPDAQDRWGVREGDRVVLNYNVACGECERCRGGERRRCLRQHGYGLWFDFEAPPFLWGGAAQYVALHPNTELVRVSDDVDPLRVCTQERLASVADWLLRVAALRPYDSLVVIGAGMLGLAATAIGGVAGAHPRITVARSQSTRLEMARAVGADYVVTGDDDEVLAGVLDATGGRGADVVIELTNATAPEATGLAVKLAARRGRIIQVATKNQADVSGFSANDLINKELTLRGVFGFEHPDLEFAMALLERDGGPAGMDAIKLATFALEDIEKSLRTVPGDVGAALTVVIP